MTNDYILAVNMYTMYAKGGPYSMPVTSLFRIDHASSLPPFSFLSRRRFLAEAAAFLIECQTNRQDVYCAAVELDPSTQ